MSNKNSESPILWIIGTVLFIELILLARIAFYKISKISDKFKKTFEITLDNSVMQNIRRKSEALHSF